MLSNASGRTTRVGSLLDSPAQPTGPARNTANQGAQRPVLLKVAGLLRCHGANLNPANMFLSIEIGKPAGQGQGKRHTASPATTRTRKAGQRAGRGRGVQAVRRVTQLSNLRPPCAYAALGGGISRPYFFP